MANALAWGFINSADLFASRVLEVGIQRTFEMVQESAAEYTRVLDALMADWVEQITFPQEQFELAGAGSLQPLDNLGNPLPVAPSGSYQVAYPIQGGGTAWGDDRVTREYLTLEETNRFTVEAEQMDKDWMIRHVIAALMTNVAWTYRDDIGVNGNKGLGNISIQPLANGDAVTYKRKGTGVPATDTHFLAQAAAIADLTNPFPTIRTELTEHPSNGSRRVIAYLATSLVTTATALLGFREVGDPDVNVGASGETLGNIPDLGVADQILGKVNNVWLAEWSALPADYLVAKVEGVAPLGMRQHPYANLQGFFPESFSPDGNRFINRMLRYCGFGVRRRVSAVVMRIGNGAYAVPTGTLAPLPE